MPFSFKNEHPIFKVAFEGDLTALQTLIKENPELASIRASNGSSLLLLAAYGGEINTLRWLLDNTDSQITETDHSGSTALLYAASNGQAATVKWLLENTKSQLAETNQYAYTPLITAAYYDDTNTVTYLLNHPNMSFKHLRITLTNSSFKLKDESECLIDKKIADYEALIERAASDEEMQGVFKVTDRKIIVADALFCPISLRLIKDPVMAADGFLYDRTSITQWLKQSNKSPKTGAKLETKSLFPAIDTKRILNNIVDAVDTLHRRLKAEKGLGPQRLLTRSLSAPKRSLLFSQASEIEAPPLKRPCLATQAQH